MTLNDFNFSNKKIVVHKRKHFQKDYTANMIFLILSVF